MAMNGVAGVLGLLMVHMVLACGKIYIFFDKSACGKILVGDGLLFLAKFYMILGMGLG